jgi:PAS domain S-box-containing protein
MPKPIRILFVDDNENDTILVASILQLNGFIVYYQRVEEKAGFQKALATGTWDVILCDYTLPRFGAFEALAIVKESYPDLPFIILSGTIGEETAVKAMQAGVYDYFLKDNLKRLPSTLARLMSETEQFREQKRREAAFRDAEELFRLLLSQVKDITIITLDPAGLILSWSDSARAFFGYEPDEVIGQYFGLLFNKDDQLNQIPEKELNEAWASGHGEDYRWMASKSGELIYVEGMATALYNATGQLKGFAKIMTNKTAEFLEHKRVEKERETLLRREREARLEAERLNRIKDDFLAVLSHELRTPLTAIIGYADLLLMNAPSFEEPAKIRHALEIIQHKSHTQLSLIEDLLDVSSIISGHFILNTQEVELAPIITAAINTIQLAAQTKGVALELKLPDSSVRVLGDPARLKQAVWNLLSNAVKFTPPCGKVFVTLRLIDHTAEIEVKDTGKGIHPEFLPHVFDLFRQEDSSTTRQYSGLGLGLVIVTHLIELHGGRTEVISEGPDKGATFTIALPLMEPTHRHSSDPAQTEEPS